MFKWLNKQGVESEKGFIVQSVDRFTIEYRERFQKISVYVEDSRLPNQKHCVIIDQDAFQKWDNGDSISKEKQKEIYKNFKEAMEFQNIAVVVY